MTIQSVLITLAMIALTECVFAQGKVVVSEKLPPASIELKQNEPPATTTPWQLPKPGDPLFNAEKESQVKDFEHTHLVYAFERGVFVGYQTLTFGTPPDRAAKELHSTFIPNGDLPADAVELSSAEKPDKSDYFQTQPKTRPANIPPNYILVRVFQGKMFVGWSYLPKESVAALHKPKKT